MKLEQRGKVLAEYIWIDGSNGMRNKTKVSILLIISQASASRCNLNELDETVRRGLNLSPTFNDGCI